MSEQTPAAEVPLPQNLRAEIDALQAARPYVPESFIDSSKAAAQYITALDHDPEAALEDDRIAQFARILGGAHFITNRWLENNQPAELPQWLYEDFVRAHFPRAKADDPARIATAYESLIRGIPYFAYQKHAGYASKNRDKTAYCPLPQTYKLYLSTGEAERALWDGSLRQTLMDVQGTQAEPRATKFYDGNDVIFYSKDSIFNGALLAAFQDNGMQPRIGQDVYVVEYKASDDVLSVGEAQSNDEAISRNVRLPNRYTSEGLLRTILSQAAWTGKSPANLYRTCFVRFLPDVGITESARREDVVQRAEQLAGYPVVEPSAIR